MRNLALIGLFCAGCGGEAFESDLFTQGERDGGSVQETGPIVQPEGSPVHEETGTGPEVSPPCTDRYLSLPGDATELFCPNLSPPFMVSGTFRLEPSDPEVRVVRDGPENPCGWSLTVRGTTVKATVTALFDHFADVPMAGTGWHRVAWRYDGELSTIMVDGSPVGVAPKPRGAWPFPACSKPARVEGSGDVDDVSIQDASWGFENGSACDQ